jgi:hypothetical protein
VYLAAACSSHHWLLVAIRACCLRWMNALVVGRPKRGWAMGCVGRAKFRPITGLCLKVAHSIVISKASHMEKKYLPLRKFSYAGFQKPYYIVGHELGYRNRVSSSAIPVFPSHWLSAVTKSFFGSHSESAQKVQGVLLCRLQFSDATL